MEFVLVTFPRIRPVRVDGGRVGQTGQVLRLQRGNHIFDLGNPRDYTPPNVQTPVVNTSPTAPMVIAFGPAAFAGGMPLAPPPPAPRAAKKKGGRKRKKAGAAKKQKTGARKAKASAAKGGRHKAAKPARRKVR